MRIVIATTEDFTEQSAINLPSKHDLLNRWLENTILEANATSHELHPAVQSLGDLIENDTTLYMQAQCMFSERPPLCTEDPSPHKARIRSYRHMLEVMNHIMTTAPEWDLSLCITGLVGFPFNIILNAPMATPSGKAFFLNEKVNAAIKRILSTWAVYLSSPASTSVLSTADGWLGPQALKAMRKQSSSGLSFSETFICDPSSHNHGFTSWDAFFTRQLLSGTRPLADATHIITNPCESSPIRLSRNVALRSRFWLKSQPYSLTHMLAHDSLAGYFVGGTVYQAYLSALSYHRWHSPVSGRVVKAYRQPGTYYSTAPYQSGRAGSNLLDDSQPYLAEVATRAMIFVEADDAEIGLVCFLPVGLAECSTCEIGVEVGQYVRKGEELGMFHFGGSSFCLLFGPEVDLEWERGVCEVEDEGYGMMQEGGNILVNSQLAAVRSRKTESTNTVAPA